MFCTKCGKALPENAAFCVYCAQPLSRQPSGAHGTVTGSRTERFDFFAPAFTGEALLGSVGVASGAVQNVIPGPGKVIGTGVRSLFSSLGSLFKEPKRLIPVIVLFVIWLALNILKSAGIDPVPTKILSFLTFANGGMSGGVAGAIGGILGKGIFAGAVGALPGLFTRKSSGKRSFGDTIKGAFGVSLDTLWAYLVGIGAAMLLYLFISGGATRLSVMGCLAASLLSARAALNQGFLQRFLGSFGSKGKASAGPNAAGLIRGTAVGFSAALMIGLSEIDLILIIAGSVLFAGGVVMMILQAAGVLKPGKGAKVS